MYGRYYQAEEEGSITDAILTEVGVQDFSLT